MKNNFNTVHYLIALLKAYGINNIVSSPGMQNSFFNATVQDDTDFRCFSIIDERSAAYVATGLAFEENKPVVVACTGATAARNYMSALTEAYYRKIPIVAITFFNPTSNKFNLAPQYTDRSVSQNDIKYISIELPLISTPEDVIKCNTFVNAALTQAFYQNKPVHINCPADLNFENLRQDLPKDYWKTDYYTEDFEDVCKELENKDFAIFIGSHNKFSDEEERAISDFAESWNIPVFCDHTSQYHGKNKIHTSHAFYMVRNLAQKPKLIIDIGNISGDYTYGAIFKDAEVWRVSIDGSYLGRSSRPLTKIFAITEKMFFSKLINKQYNNSNYYTKIKNSIEKIKYPELPLSTAYVCQSLAKYIPNNSSLHLAILNSLRNMNFFNLHSSISVNCNVGGFGIDGAVSTLVGQSVANPNKKCFGVIGDLAFFYDMNALGIRHIRNNLRIIVINNNKGMEFRIGKELENILHDDIDILIAAGGHNKGGAKGWAEACGFEYLCANTKENFNNQINAFCNENFSKPVLFEIFTNTKDEQDAINSICDFNKNKIEETLIKSYKAIIR